MSETPKYTDRQMALILKRAASLQASGDEGRFSLEEVRQIAAQVGIPAELVTRAANELTAGAEGSGIGGPGASYYATRAVPGAVSPSDYPELLSIIRRVTRDPGKPSDLAGALEWRSSTGYSSLAVTIAPGKDEAVIRVEGEFGGQKMVSYLIAGAATGLATLAALGSGNPVVAAGVAGGVGLLSVTGARLLWGRLARRAEERVSQLRDALAAGLGKRAGPS
jgi:hypothetical protein